MQASRSGAIHTVFVGLGICLRILLINNMLALCPYPDCRLLYRTLRTDPTERVAKCTHCGRLGTLRSSKIWRKMLSNVIVRQKTGQLQFAPDFVDEISPLSAIVEDVRSLMNVGSIFRTADAAGINQLYLCGITGCPPRKEIAKTSLGAEDHVAWEYFAHPLDIILSLKRKGVTVLGLEKTEHSRALPDLFVDNTLSKPLCFVVGNEITGVSPEVLANCDYVCHLPMKGFKESLNVSVAFGVAAYFLELFA
jgi:23S rRNA (guanosine2251-2'-O)-methyltransferase